MDEIAETRTVSCPVCRSGDVAVEARRAGGVVAVHRCADCDQTWAEQVVGAAADRERPATASRGRS